ncbi:MAG: hypothetical protein AAFP13_04415 [Pseudomonadota bacterium]
MHPADEYARLKAVIRSLEARAKVLRDGFAAGQMPQRSEAMEVVVQRVERKVFLRDRLPPEVLGDPRFWETRTGEVVRIRQQTTPDTPEPAPKDAAFDVLDTW